MKKTEIMWKNVPRLLRFTYLFFQRKIPQSLIKFFLLEAIIYLKFDEIYSIAIIEADLNFGDLIEYTQFLNKAMRFISIFKNVTAI